MGYDTYYELGAYDPNDTLTNIIVNLKDVKFEEGSYLKYLQQDGWEGTHRWYDHDNDLLDLSLKYPDMIFQLTGYGENTGDVWRVWYYRGKLEYWEFPGFDIPDVSEKKDTLCTP